MCLSLLRLCKPKLNYVQIDVLMDVLIEITPLWRGFLSK